MVGLRMLTQLTLLRNSLSLNNTATIFAGCFKHIAMCHEFVNKHQVAFSSISKLFS